MTGEQLKAVFDFEDSLHLGMAVKICWTNNGHRHSGIGFVSKINKKSVRATLNHAVPCGVGGEYPVGREIIVPKISDIKGWSYNNRVEPVDGYPEIN